MADDNKDALPPAAKLKKTAASSESKTEPKSLALPVRTNPENGQPVKK